MTTAKEIGVSYSKKGLLIQPGQRPRLNEGGARYASGYATIFGIPLEVIIEGYEIQGFVEGANGLTVNMLVYDRKFDLVGIPINVERDDYFLPLVDKPPVEIDYDKFLKRHPELTFEVFVQECVDGKILSRSNFEGWCRRKYIEQFKDEYSGFLSQKHIKFIKAMQQGNESPPRTGNFYDWLEKVKGIELTPDERSLCLYKHTTST